MPKAKRKAMTGRGTVEKLAIVGAENRSTNKVYAERVGITDRETLRKSVEDAAILNPKVYTDESLAYKGMARQHEAICHSTDEYARDQAQTNGVESFWAMLKRAYKGISHHFSVKRLHRRVNEFSGRHSIRALTPLSR